MWLIYYTVSLKCYQICIQIFCINQWLGAITRSRLFYLKIKYLKQEGIIDNRYSLRLSKYSLMYLCPAFFFLSRLIMIIIINTKILHWVDNMVITYEPRHEKPCFCHMRTTKAQIRLRGCYLVVHCLDSILPLVSISEISSLYLASVAEQAGLSLT